MNETSCPFDISPYDQIGQVKTPALVNVNYTNQDFWSMKARLLSFIQQWFADQFNDFVESSIAVMLIENWAFIADTLSFKIDQIANEIFIDTVSEVDNAFRLARLVGFQPLPPIASSSFWSAMITNVQATDLVIPTPVQIDFTTEVGSKTIELYPADAEKQPVFTDDIIIPAGSTVNTNIIGLEGTTRTQSVVGTGQPNQSVALSYGPVIWQSVTVNVDGNDWYQVDYFTDSQPRPEFRVEYDPDYNAYVMFGNSLAGQIPSPSSNINITYRMGGGLAGNIVTGAVDVQRGFILGGFDFRVPVTFRNYTKGDFGYDGDTIEDIKRKLPPYLRSQNRIVSSSDFYAFINQFSTAYNGSIGKGTAILRNYGCAANVVDAYVLAKSGDQGLAEASPELKQALLNQINANKMLNCLVCVNDGEVIDVDVTIDVVLDRFYRKFQDEFDAKVQSRLGTFFSLNNWDFSQTLKASDIVKVLSDITEIQSVDVNLLTNSQANSGGVVTAKYYQIVRPNILTINYIYDQVQNAT